jgi:hypothetical protein
LYPFSPSFFQFEVYKCCHGDDIEEHDEYFNSSGGNICIPEGSEQAGLGCLIYDGTLLCLACPSFYFQVLANEFIIDQ